MYISNLKIKNYRTFKDFSIDLKPLTLIIGENNVGKSNLLDCIGLIFGQEVSYFKKRVLEVADFNYSTVCDFKRRILNTSINAEDIEYPEISISVTLTDWDADQESVIADWYLTEDFSIAGLTYIFAPNSRFDKIAHVENQRAFIEKYKTEHSLEAYEKLSEIPKLDLINLPVSNYHYNIYGGVGNTTLAGGYHLNQLRFELLNALRETNSYNTQQNTSNI
ncbi:MAG: hypothetical protein DI538_06195 [Azospira oryzae]|nr:MAG: hypothetical protein DI538_06195 [Azospira oryzae]